MDITVYEFRYDGIPNEVPTFSFEQRNPNGACRVGYPPRDVVYRADASRCWCVSTPTGSEIEQPDSGESLLAWTRGAEQFRSTADNVMSFARAGINGFGNVRLGECVHSVV